MKTAILSLILISLLFFVSLSSAGITVDKTTVNITAGDSFILLYNITGSSSNCFVSVSITPDPEGFSLSYINSFKLPSTFVLRVNTSMLLSPGTYYITTTFSTDDIPSPKVSRHTHHVTPTESPVPVIPVNVTQPAENETSQNTTLPPGNSPVKSEFPCLYVFIIIIISISVLLLCIVRKKQKGKLKK